MQKNLTSYLQDFVKHLIRDPRLMFWVTKLQYTLYPKPYDEILSEIIARQSIDVVKTCSALGIDPKESAPLNDFAMDVEILLNEDKSLLWAASEKNITSFFQKGEIDLAKKELDNVTTKLYDISSCEDVFVESAIEEILNEKKKYADLDWGIESINNIMRYIEEDSMTILAARPSMGKTSFMINLGAINFYNRPVLCFSLEQSKSAITQRLLATALKLSLNNIQACNFSSQDRAAIVKFMQNIKGQFLIFDRVRTINDIIHTIKYYAHKYPNALILIDYLQLIESSNKKGRDSKNEEVEDIVNALKHTIKEVKMPMILLSQLSRMVEQRENKIPQLSDLRSSGAIEQTADVVGFLYRPSYYDEDADKNEAFFRVAKNRNGEVGDVKLFVDLSTQTWK